MSEYLDGQKEANEDILKMYERDKNQLLGKIKAGRRKIGELRENNVERTKVILDNQGQVQRNEYEISQIEKQIQLYNDEIEDINKQL